jgi:hypothetical protein
MTNTEHKSVLKRLQRLIKAILALFEWISVERWRTVAHCQAPKLHKEGKPVNHHE